MAAIVKARAELEDALFELEKLRAISQSSVFFAAHALNNFLTVTGGTVELLSLSLKNHPDPQVHIGLEALQQLSRPVAGKRSMLAGASLVLLLVLLVFPARSDDAARQPREANPGERLRPVAAAVAPTVHSAQPSPIPPQHLGRNRSQPC